jgi:hypothetical protein
MQQVNVIVHIDHPRLNSCERREEVHI